MGDRSPPCVSESLPLFFEFMRVLPLDLLANSTKKLKQFSMLRSSYASYSKTVFFSWSSSLSILVFAYSISVSYMFCFFPFLVLDRVSAKNFPMSDCLLKELVFLKLEFM